MAHWSGIDIPKTNAMALEVSYTHTLHLLAVAGSLVRATSLECLWRQQG